MFELYVPCVERVLKTSFLCGNRSSALRGPGSTDTDIVFRPSFTSYIFDLWYVSVLAAYRSSFPHRYKVVLLSLCGPFNEGIATAGVFLVCRFPTKVTIDADLLDLLLQHFDLTFDLISASPWRGQCGSMWSSSSCRVVWDVPLLY